MSYRVGNGFDIHVFVSGRPFMLGGIQIPHNKGLLGHSDGDCAMHALIEALLGACGLGDIGTVFPPDDPNIAGINSLLMLDKVYELVKSKGFVLENADLSIICEEPKLKPHYTSMRKVLSERLCVGFEQVNVKARTAEKLGPIGQGEACAAICTALLRKL